MLTDLNQDLQTLDDLWSEYMTNRSLVLKSQYTRCLSNLQSAEDNITALLLIRATCREAAARIDIRNLTTQQMGVRTSLEGLQASFHFLVNNYQ